MDLTALRAVSSRALWAKLRIVLLDGKAPEVHVLRRIIHSVFSEAFLVGGEDELREAEL